MLHPFNPMLKVVASPALMERGSVQTIGLEEIQAEIGPRWDKLKDSIWAHLETLLRQKLGPADFYVQLDETSFLVSMPAAILEEAQIYCLRIANELHTSLLGRSDPAKLRIARAIEIAGDNIRTVPVTGDQLSVLAMRARLDTPPDGAAQPASHKNPGPGKLASKIDFSHKFVPLWDAQNQAITTYRCFSAVDQKAAENAGLDKRIKSEIALTVSRIRFAAGALSARLGAGERFLIWIPISYDVLGSPVGRMEIASTCRNLSSELRPYLIFEISDLPHGVPQSRMSDLVGSLRPFCRGVVALLPAGTANYGAYAGAGLYAIGLSFAGGEVGGMELGSELFKLCLAAKKQRIMSFALDVPGDDLLQAARAEGVNLLSSPLIGSPQDMPAAISRLLACDIAKAAIVHVIAA
jgi:hypothetical protein